MQIRRHKTTSEVSKVKLATVWQPSNGKFDDGIAVINPDPEAKLEKYGPCIRSLMNKFGISEKEMEVAICIDCGCKHRRRVRRCAECNEKHLAKGFSVRQ